MTQEQSIGLIGAGAVGSLLAATLVYNGRDINWVVRNAQRRQDLRYLTLGLPDEQLDLDCGRLKIARDIDELPAHLDWIILAVKAQHVDGVLAELAPKSPANVLVVANGLHAFDAHLGLLYGGARLAGSTVQACAQNQLVMGPLNAFENKAAELVLPLTAPWLTTGCKEEIATRMWHKLALNCVVNPLTALLDCLNGDLPVEEDSPLIRALLEEISQVAGAELNERWAYTPDQLYAALVKLLHDTAANSSSMREDLRRGQETEIVKMNIAVAKTGERYFIPCPVNAELGDMLFLLANKLPL